MYLTLSDEYCHFEREICSQTKQQQFSKQEQLISDAQDA